LGLLRSHELLEKGGFIADKPTAAGVWYILPLGLRVLERVNRLVWRVMEEHGAQNLLLPMLQPASDWVQSERWEKYVRSKTMFQTKENHSGAAYGLGPTAEEQATSLVARFLRSWRQLPLFVHQIGPKWRDEIRPRFGLLRGREFWMSDAYSFDADEAGMHASYENMRAAYTEIFEACGLVFISVQADSGAIGGSGSVEFMALADAGEDTLLTCTNCDYGANVEKAVAEIPTVDFSGEEKPMHKEATPSVRTVEELAAFFPGLTPGHMAKTIVFNVDGAPVAVVIRGDLDVNSTKLTNLLKATLVEPAEDEMVVAATGAPVGFAGPVHLPKTTRVLFDASVAPMRNFLCGTNEADVHVLDVNHGRDFPEPEAYHDLASAQEGFGCAQCQEGTLKVSRGIEVGHIFMLQQGYAEAFGATFTDQAGKVQTPWMGTYGIGTSRVVQAIVEQSHDKHGIIWPEAVAPYSVIIVPVNVSDPTQRELAERLYTTLTQGGCEVLLDDRELHGGEKFADADLLGIPWQIIVGRGASEGTIELKERKTGNRTSLSADEALARFA
jgi:prolyl-tRNA synthetase